MTTYRDIKGIPTIGYGSTRNALPGKTITQEEAEKILLEDLSRFEKTINAEVTVDLKQNQYDALVCLVFNIGQYSFKKSTVLKYINAGDFKNASLEFGKWIYAGTKVSKGLLSRRRRERELFDE